jgi:mannitol/fructose-specific phosphotransferase system IIA component (Ntr-type)
MSLSVFDVLTSDRIALDLKSRGQAEAIAETSGLLNTSPYMLDLRGFVTEVLAREKVSPTAVGNGLAFPHARTSTVDQIVMAAGRCRDGIAFEDGADPVHLIFVIGTPKNMVREYLGLVGDLARRLKQNGMREQLLNAPTSVEFLAALKAVPRI